MPHRATTSTSVLSPCVGQCRLDPGNGLCDGCHRSGAEIAVWPDADEPTRRAIVARAAARVACPSQRH